MDQQLINLIDDCLSIALQEGLASDDPITVKFEHVVSGDSALLIAAFSEPHEYKLPANVTWIDADPLSPSYRKAFIRTSKNATPPYQHSWSELSAYNDVFTPPQYYDSVDLPSVESTLSSIEAHLQEKLPDSDPHNAKQYVDQQIAFTFSTTRNMFNNLNQRVITNDLRIRELEGLNIEDALNGMQLTINSLIQSRDDYGTRITYLEEQLANGGGGGTPAPGLNTYNHTYSTPEYLWVVNHNFGTANFVPYITDLNDEPVLPDRIEKIDNDIAVVYFSAPQSGKVTLISA